MQLLQQREGTGKKYVAKLLDLDWRVGYTSQDGRFCESSMLVTELAEQGDLLGFMLSTGPFPSQIARTYAHQLAEGLTFAHQNGVYHRDVKPDNLLLTGDCQLVITDFGLSTRNHGISLSNVGTSKYKAPEMFVGGGAYAPDLVDVWAYGIVLFIMVKGYPPMHRAVAGDAGFDMLCCDRQCGGSTFWQEHDTDNRFGPDGRQLLEKVLHPHPKERWNFDQIMQSEWYSKETLTQEHLKAAMLERKEVVARECAELRRQRRQARRRADTEGHHEHQVLNANSKKLSFRSRFRGRNYRGSGGSGGGGSLDSEPPPLIPDHMDVGGSPLDYSLNCSLDDPNDLVEALHNLLLGMETGGALKIGDRSPVYEQGPSSKWQFLIEAPVKEKEQAGGGDAANASIFIQLQMYADADTGSLVIHLHQAPTRKQQSHKACLFEVKRAIDAIVEALLDVTTDDGEQPLSAGGRGGSLSQARRSGSLKEMLSTLPQPDELM